jgi:hypothetical protein
MTPQDAPTTPQQTPATHHFVPIADAVGILGLSATTIRRKIARGELVAERLARPQGTAFLVQVPHDAPEGATTPQEPPETHHDAPPGAEYLAAVLAPLIATIERQAEQLISQAETIGELRAQNRTLEARTGPQSVESTPEPPEPLKESHGSVSGRAVPRAVDLHALAPWLLSLLAIAAVVMLLAAWRW